MSMPGFTAEAAVYSTEANYYGGIGNAAGAGGAGAVVPQASVCSPCIRVGGQQLCVNLPIFGRRCLRVPFIGRWRLCCRTRFGWPPIRCGVQGC